MGCEEQYNNMTKYLGWDDNYNLTSSIISLEVTLDCAGICEHNPIYVFSDINRGPPTSK